MQLLTTLKHFGFLLIPVLLVGCGTEKTQQRGPENVIHVDTLTIIPSTLRLTNELPGRITAYKEAEVRPQVSGIVKSREFKEGGEVFEGDVLYKIDASVYEAAVNSAEAQLVKANTTLKSTHTELKRYAQLLKKKLASQQLYDDANTEYLQAKAEVAIRQADLDYANIQLSYTEIKAPISGQIRASEINEGALVTADQASLLTTILQIDQVYIEMQQTSVSLYQLRQEFNKKDRKELNVPVTITLEDGTEYAETGYLEFSDLQVDNSTGSVTLRALVANPDHALLPGIFVRATIALPEEKSYLVIPQSIVSRSQSGVPSVYVVNDKNVVEKKVVKLGREIDNTWIVTEGLTSGDKVVINNLMKVKDKIEVVIDTESSDI